MGQDWGGRRKQNPENCPVVTVKQVTDKALSMSVEVKRGDFHGSKNDRWFGECDHGTWWYLNKLNGMWYTIGDTNYLALCELSKIDKLSKLETSIQQEELCEQP
jgi:hypothetical protein